MRTRYWSCTPLADWIRGTTKPGALGWDEWDTWNAEAQVKHPVRYWIAETLLDNIQKAIYYVPDRIADGVGYCRYRFVRRSHLLVTNPQDVVRGEYVDLWTRMFYASFNELVNYVEIDKAIENVRWDVEARHKYNAPKRLFRWPYIRGWRSAAAGLDYLNWEAGLEEPKHQAEQAREILELYHWWKTTRPQRPEASDASGWTDWVLNKKPISRRFQTTEQAEESQQIIARMEELHKQYDQEDVDQLVRLVKLRWGLSW